MTSGARRSESEKPPIRAAIIWGVVVGAIQAASPLGFWWLNPATVYGLELALIASVYIGFAVADGLDDEVARLEGAVNRPLEEIRRVLSSEEDDTLAAPIVEGSPTIAITSHQGAKGLQAEHVFVVGMNEPHFPSDNDAPDELEVCEMLVALTRATKCCHLVSCRPFGRDWLEPSVFIDWLGDAVDKVAVAKDYWST